MFLGGVPLARAYEFDLGVGHWRVVDGAVKVEGDVLAVEHSDKLEDVGDGGESRECGPGGDRGGIAMVMAIIGVRQRRQ